MSEPGWLLDTNVVAELSTARPNDGVLRFVAKLDSFILASVVVFELERGIARLPRGRRRNDLMSWLEALLAGPVVVVGLDVAAARSAARIEVLAASRGRSIEARDALIVGTAASAKLGVATRNVAHLAGHGVRTFDPFA